jgi:hypothetical protein
MLVLLAALTVGYLVVVLRVRRVRRTARPAPVQVLPVDDRPPSGAVGWPPRGKAFEPYVEQGFAELDAYLSEGFAA